MQLGIATLTPAGLLVGAKSIVSHNKQLRTEMKELERELETIQGQNEFMVSLVACTYYVLTYIGCINFSLMCAMISLEVIVASDATKLSLSDCIGGDIHIVVF